MTIYKHNEEIGRFCCKIKQLVIYTCLLISCQISAQNNDLLKYFDEQTSALISETDKNQYSYMFPRWHDFALKVLEQTPDSVIQSYNFNSFSHLQTDSIDIFYFIKNINNINTINWIACSYGDNRKFVIFNDSFEANSKQIPVVSTTNERDMKGFDIKDSLTQVRLFWVPDINTRINFETLVDIKYSEAEKELAQKAIRIALSAMFYSDEATTFSLDGYPRVKSVEDQLKTIRIVTYTTSYADFTSKCHGFVIHKTDNGDVKIEYLEDCTDKIKTPEHTKTKAEKWYGAIYSQLIECKINKQTYYTLLGFKSNDGMVKTRVVDILSFKNGKSVFGAPYFLHSRATYQRRVFKYSSEANMMLRYDDKSKQIVFDHLSPSDSMFSGEFRFYGPDFSYDAYELTKNGWEIREDIDYKEVKK